jgi:gliding motility-associated-like protein
MKTYLWSTGATTQNITANTPGIYSVRVTDNCNLVKADTISINILPKPIIQLGSDTSLCGNDPLVLNAGNAGSSFLWNDGSTSATFTVTNSGTYWVIVTNAYGCESKDSIIVNYSTSGDQRGFQMPSAFTPNRDGLNDCFGLKKWGNVKVIRFEVYNRWGELIFKGKSVSDCWDGTWKGQKQANSPFPYIVVVESACGIIERKGLVSIIQ